MTALLQAYFEKRFTAGAVIRAAIDRCLERFSVGALFGPSGCGKTTILRCLAGLERPESGSIQFCDEIWFDSEKSVFLPPQQRGIGYLFQEYALFPHLTVEQNIAYGLHKSPKAERRRRVGEMLDALQLVGLERRYPSELSGGQQQRVALARSVVTRPKLLLLDEPLSALDAPTREQVRPELHRYLTDFKIPSIVVTHDRIEALVMADYMTVLEKGEVLQSGPSREVFSRPNNLAVARIVGVETIEAGRVLSVDNGLATVKVGETQLLALAHASYDGEGEGEAYICIRAEDVILQKGVSGPSSARNQLVGEVRSMKEEGPMMRVSVACGFPLTVLVTRLACEDLDLSVGEKVTALVKTSSVHLLPMH